MKPKFKNKTKIFEGKDLNTYYCTGGKLSIGYGYNLENGISDQIADFLFDIKWNESVAEACRFKWFTEMNEARQYVIVDMIYNMGLPKFKEFKKTIAHLEKHQYDLASREMLNSKWRKDVGDRADQLAQIMDTGMLE